MLTINADYFACKYDKQCHVTMKNMKICSPKTHETTAAQCFENLIYEAVSLLNQNSRKH